MQESSELRWFFTEKKDIEILERWFQKRDLQFRNYFFDRQDYYLVLPGVNSLGIKLREATQDFSGKWLGKLESKILVKDVGEIDLPGGNVGICNEWRKFSFVLPAGEATLEAIISSLTVDTKKADVKNWVKMSKQRLLLIYDLEQRKIVINEAAVHEGCGIELTMIEMNEVLCYSFAFEGFSATGRHPDNLVETVQYIFEECKITGLSAAGSYAYPEFLIKHL